MQESVTGGAVIENARAAIKLPAHRGEHSVTS
jgi:hypothetical protein